MTLTFPATCAPFTACGGALPGTYFYTSGCLDDAEFQPLIDATKLCGMPVSTITNKMGTIQGGLTFSATQVSRFAQGSLNFTLNIPGANCTSICPLISSQLSMYGVTGSCALNTTNVCVCTLARPWGTGATENYTSANNQVTVPGSGTAPTKIYDYCITNNGANLAYHEVTVLDAGTYIKDPGYFSLTK